MEPCAINNLLFTVLSYDVIVDSKWVWSPGVGSVLPPGGGGWGLCGCIPVVDIPVTEWVNVKNKISDGERTGMSARSSHWHDFRIYY